MPGRLLQGIRGSSVAALAALAGCTSEDPLLDVEAGLFAPKLEGDVGLSLPNSRAVASLDVDGDLDLGATSFVPYVHGEFDLGRLNLAVSGFKTSSDGSSVLPAAFGNIPGGTAVTSDLDLALANGRLVIDVFDNDLFKIGAGLAAEWVDLKLDASAPSVGIAESISVQQIVPLIAAHAAARLDLPFIMPLRFDVNAAGITLDYGEIDGTVLDVEALLRGELGRVGIFAGYRRVLAETRGRDDGQEFEGDVTLSGWLVGFSVRI